MIKSVTVTNYLKESITLYLDRPEKSGLIIKEIQGLGPVKATINSKEIATGDGSVFNSSRITSRNIVMKLGFLPNLSIEDTRLKTYKYFPIKKQITFKIETDNRIAECTGYVETNEPDIFSSSEGCQISIICPDPYFYSAGEDGSNVTVFSGVEASFEFPFNNESTSYDLLEMGIIQHSTKQTIYYNGDAQVGITIDIKASGNVKNISIYNTLTRESMFIDTSKIEKITGEGVKYGDEIIISTVKNNKYVMLLRDGKFINILNALDRFSDWFSLAKGDNIFAYTADEGAINLMFRIINKSVYEGV